MALIIKTANPKHLLEQINSRVSENSIGVWRKDEDGDFTSVMNSLQYKAWFHPVPINKIDELQFAIIASTRYSMTKAVYATYHALFSEMLLENFDTIIDGIQIQSKLDPDVDKY